MSDKTLGDLWIISSFAGILLAYVRFYLSDHPTSSLALALNGDEKRSLVLQISERESPFVVRHLRQHDRPRKLLSQFVRSDHTA
jgi:hypothetical protein